MARADKLAEGTDEKAEVSEWRARVNAALLKRSEEIAGDAKQKLAKANEVCRNLQRSKDLNEMAPLAVELDHLIGQVETIRGLPPEIAEVARSYRKRLEGENERAAQMEKERKEQEERIAKIRSALREAKSLLPDLTAYAGRLKAHQEEFADIPEFQMLAKWEPLVPQYKAVIALGADVSLVRENVRPKGTDSALLPYRELMDHVLRLTRDVQDPYSVILDRERQRMERLRQAKPQMERLVATLGHNLMTKLCQFTVTDKEMNGEEVYYTDEEARLDIQNMAYVVRYYPDGKLKPKIWSWPSEKYTVSKPGLAPHCKCAKTVRDEIEKELTDPDWVPAAPRAMFSVLNTEGMNPWPCAVLIERVVEFDKGTTGSLELTERLEDAVAALRTTEDKDNVDFWIPGDSALKDRLQRIQRRIDALKPELAKHLEAVASLKGTRILEAAGLCRPLVFSGIVAKDEQARNAVEGAQEAGDYPEYWTIVDKVERPEFMIVARKDRAGSLKWLGADSVVPGQPLLSPVDRESALEFLTSLGEKAGTGRQGKLKCWPSNLDVLKK